MSTKPDGDLDVLIFSTNSGNQHSTPTSHQTVGGNYQPALSSPATTPHMPQSPYSGNAQQVNTSHYPQHIPTQFNTQAKGLYIVVRLSPNIITEDYIQEEVVIEHVLIINEKYFLEIAVHL